MIRMLAAISFFISLSMMHSQVFAESRTESKKRLMVEDSYEASRGKLFDEEAYFRGETPWGSFANVIVINKAARGPLAQTLRLYTNHQLVVTTRVSTGREDLEFINPIRGIINGIFKGATNSHWRHTTRGFYSIRRVESAGYQSGENKFHMPYAMFFNEARGLAIHQVPPDLSGGERSGERALGSRASSGCVRVHKNVIQKIHSAVLNAESDQIPIIDSKTGALTYDSNNNIRYRRGYNTLVIVEEY